jgi:prepilin-type N-terminal cleavage/methylation domain-containing protein
MQAAGNTYPQNKNAIQSKDGFTLVEVIVSMFLMAIVFTAAFGTYFLGMRMVEDAREELRASQIVQSELERMRTLTWDDLEELDPFSPFSPQGNFVNQFSKNYNCYRWVYQMNSSQKRVIIYVQWVNSRGDTTWQVFNTVFTRNGLNDYYYSTPA